MNLQGNCGKDAIRKWNIPLLRQADYLFGPTFKIQITYCFTLGSICFINPSVIAVIFTFIVPKC